MKQWDAIQALRLFDQKGRYVFIKNDLVKLFSHDAPKTFDEGLNRLVKTGVLKRVCRGVYVNEQAQCCDPYTIEHIAKTLRRNFYNYVSLESMLSEYGLISQIPLDRLTIMTTGRSGIYKTDYGTIEFTHTKRTLSTLLDHMQRVEGRPLRIATKEMALRDLKRVGRNLHLIQREQDDE